MALDFDNTYLVHTPVPRTIERGAPTLVPLWPRSCPVFMERAPFKRLVYGNFSDAYGNFCGMYIIRICIDVVVTVYGCNG